MTSRGTHRLCLPSRIRTYTRAPKASLYNNPSISARSQARTHVRTYVHGARERHKRTNARTHPHVRSLNAALGSSVEATNTLQRINRITAPPGIRSPPFCHGDVYARITHGSRYEITRPRNPCLGPPPRLVIPRAHRADGTPRENLDEAYPEIWSGSRTPRRF